MIERNKDLTHLNTMGISCSADLFMAIKDPSELVALWKTTLPSLSSMMVLGGGSNVLFQGNYRGLILKNELLGKVKIEENEHHVMVQIGGGESWHECVMWAVENGWGGIENLSLIPGTAGAAPIQNIGAYGVELKDVFYQLTAFDWQTGKFQIFNVSECQFGYRDSIFKRHGKGRYFITEIQLKLSKNAEIKTHYGDIQQLLLAWGITQPGISDVSKAVIHIRKSKLPDPAELGNCGSFFKNPVISKELFESLQLKYPDIKGFPLENGNIKIPAAWLIEKDGWKGKKVGHTGSHEKQALVLVNYGGASGKEIYALALQIQSSIAAHFGVHLEPEVNLIPTF